MLSRYNPNFCFTRSHFFHQNRTSLFRTTNCFIIFIFLFYFLKRIWRIICKPNIVFIRFKCPRNICFIFFCFYYCFCSFPIFIIITITYIKPLPIIIIIIYIMYFIFYWFIFYTTSLKVKPILKFSFYLFL